MVNMIEAHLRRLRRNIRWRAALTGIFLLFATLTVGTGAIAGLDWYFEFSAGMRVLLLVALLAFSGWVAWRLLIVPVATTFSDVWLALQIERHYPELRDWLTSAVSFLRADESEEVAGSVELREAVVRAAERAALTVEPGMVLRRRPFRWAAAAFALTLALSVAMAIVMPGLVRTGLARVFLPFGDARWPHQTVLEFVELKQRLARGEPFTVRVKVVSGRVPDSATATFEFQEGGSALEPMRARGRREFVASLDTVLSPFKVRVNAGSAVLGPVAVDVLPPPDVQELKLSVRYPDYTGRGTETLPDGVGHVKAVRGSRVQLAATFSKPVRSASIVFDDGNRLPLELDADRKAGQTEFPLTKDGSYWLKLVDDDGLTNRDFSRFELRALEDKPPEVFVDKPQGAVYVTPQAQLPIRVTVKDDFGVKRVWLAYWKGEQQPQAPGEVELAAPEQPAKRIDVQYGWELRGLALSVGEVVSFYLAAADADTLHGPNVGKSRVFRAYVVTGDELLERLVDRQRAIQEELERTLRQQQEAAADVDDLLEEARQDAQVEERTVGELRATELSQQQVRRRLTGTSGLMRLARETLEQLENNRLEQDEFAQRLRELITATETLDRSALQEAERQLLVARKAAESAAGRNSPLPERGEQALAGAREAQEVVTRELQRMLEEFGRYENLRAIARDAERLVEQQQQLLDQSRQLGARTVGKDLSELPPELRAGLGKLANRQDQLRSGLQQLRERMRQLSQKLAQEDPVAAETLRQAAENSERAGTGELMREAAQQLRSNRVGEASERQQQAAEDLKNLLDALQQNSTPDLKELVRQLRQLEQQLEQLRKRQLQLLQRTQRASNEQDEQARRRELQRLARQQRQLERELSRLAQQMARLNARNAARRSSSAAGQMGQAAQQLQADQGNQAQQQQQRVLEDLQQAQQELQRARREAEALLAMEQLRRIESQLVSLYERQKAAAAETRRIHQLRTARARARWTRPLLASLGRLRQEQQHIRTETATATETLDSAPVFALVLKRAMSLMDEAVQRLKQRHADAATASLQDQAAAQIAKLLEALKQDRAEGQQPRNSGSGGGGGGGGGGSGISLVAQLKLLKMLQIEIKEATEQIERLRQQGPLPPQQRQRLEELQTLQGELADIVRQLTRPSPEPQEQGESP